MERINLVTGLTGLFAGKEGSGEGLSPQFMDFLALLLNLLFPQGDGFSRTDDLKGEEYGRKNEGPEKSAETTTFFPGCLLPNFSVSSSESESQPVLNPEEEPPLIPASLISGEEGLPKPVFPTPERGNPAKTDSYSPENSRSLPTEQISGNQPEITPLAQDSFRENSDSFRELSLTTPETKEKFFLTTSETKENELLEPSHLFQKIHSNSESNENIITQARITFPEKQHRKSTPKEKENNILPQKDQSEVLKVVFHKKFESINNLRETLKNSQRKLELKLIPEESFHERPKISSPKNFSLVAHDFSGSGPSHSVSQTSATPPGSQSTGIPPVEMPGLIKEMVLEVHPSGEKKARIKLEPPDLGEVEVDLRVHHREVSLFLRVEKPEAAHQLQMHLSHLQRALDELGFQLADFQVLFTGSESGWRFREDNGREELPGEFTERVEEVQERESPERTDLQGKWHNGRVNLIV